jgi:hypothetical protein
MAVFHLITVVWGRNFVRTYLDLILPTQLSPGNLPAFADAPGSLYKVYTTTADAQVIRNDPRFIEAERHLRTQIIEFAPSPEGLEFDAMIQNHRRAIIEANAVAAVIIVLSPDAICADGSFAALRRLHQAGKRLVLLTGFRASLDALSQLLPQMAPPDACGAVTLPPRLLMRMALAHPHPISRALFWDAESFTYHPSNLYWWVRKEPPRAILARCFHLHPLMVDPERKDLAPESSIDDDYIHTACPNPDTHHIVTDSDEIACVELSREDHLGNSVGDVRASVTTVAVWCFSFCNKTHLNLAQQAILLHDGPAPAQKAAVEARSHKLVERIFRALKAHRHRIALLKRYEPWLRWRGWLFEQYWLSSDLRLRRIHRGGEAQIFRLDACWPTDLIVVQGIAFGHSPLRVRMEVSGQLVCERFIPPGPFEWAMPAHASYHLVLQYEVFDRTPKNYVRVKRIGLWRTVIHHLKHDYQSKRPAPLWLEWEGLLPGHRLNGPAKLRVIPHWGVVSVTLTIESIDDAGQTASPPVSIILPLASARPDEFISVNLSGTYRLLAVKCNEKRSWRVLKGIAQILQVTSTLFTKAGWWRLGRRLLPRASGEP